MNEQPCPYPGCGDVRGHPRPHLMEAAFIEKRLVAARNSGAKAERERVVGRFLRRRGEPK